MFNYYAIEAFMKIGNHKYNDEDFNNYFFNTLKNFGNERLNLLQKDKINEKELPDHSYTYNSLGYRSDEFESPSEILAAGCSHTWGVGVPDNNNWPYFLSKETGMSVSNTALPGRSVAEIIKGVFAYFKEVGNPKIICIYLPDLYRYSTVKTAGYMHPISERPSIVCHTNVSASTHKIVDRPKYLSAPYFIEEVVTEEMAIWSNLFYIEILEQYCKTAGIDLYYTFWEDSTDRLINYVKSVSDNIYNRYYNFDNNNWQPPLEKSLDQFYYKDNKKTLCHSELINEINKPYWSMAGDKDLNSITHIGVHRHIHVAERFAELINGVQK